MLIVSENISKGDFDSLNNLVHEDSLKEIKKNYEGLSAQQRKLIAVRVEDIQGQVPYLFQTANDEKESRTFVKIGVLYFVVPGLADTLQKVFSPTQNMSNGSEFNEVSKTFKHNLIVADYR
jgi:hypothetical protein